MHAQIFAGVDRATFGRYVVDSTAERTEILRHRNADGEVVGYLAMHVFDRQLDGRPTTVLRAEAGLLRDYRGGNASASFSTAGRAARAPTTPGRPAYYLGSLVHPSSYALLARYTPGLWPRAGARDAAELLSLHERAGRRVRPGPGGRGGPAGPSGGLADDRDRRRARLLAAQRQAGGPLLRRRQPGLRGRSRARHARARHGAHHRRHARGDRAPPRAGARGRRQGAGRGDAARGEGRQRDHVAPAAGQRAVRHRGRARPSSGSPSAPSR